MGRQLEVSLWLENKGLPPESPKKPEALAVSTWGCGPTSVPPRVVPVTWKRPTGPLHPVLCFLVAVIHRHAKQCSGAHISRSLWAQSQAEALGCEETCVHTHAHL